MKTQVMYDGNIYECCVENGNKMVCFDNWAIIWDMVNDGMVKAVSYGPSTYGHTDFFLMSHAPFSRLRMYKTAYSPMYKKFVGILGIYKDETGVPIIKAYFEGSRPEKYILFREHELTDYVL